jgi:hypothetical protein
MTNPQRILKVTSLRQKVQPKIDAANYTAEAGL